MDGDRKQAFLRHRLNLIAEDVGDHGAHVFVGDRYAASDVELLAENGITAVLNCAYDLDVNYVAEHAGGTVVGQETVRLRARAAPGRQGRADRRAGQSAGPARSGVPYARRDAAPGVAGRAVLSRARTRQHPGPLPGRHEPVGDGHRALSATIAIATAGRTSRARSTTCAKAASSFPRNTRSRRRRACAISRPRSIVS